MIFSRPFEAHDGERDGQREKKSKDKRASIWHSYNCPLILKMYRTWNMAISQIEIKNFVRVAEECKIVTRRKWK